MALGMKFLKWTLFMLVALTSVGILFAWQNGTYLYNKQPTRHESTRKFTYIRVERGKCLKHKPIGYTALLKLFRSKACIVVDLFSRK